jgi:uncharacterized protein (DUF1501 family)
MTANRRDFLRASLASAGVVAWGLGVPGFVRRTAGATPPAGRAGARDSVLVVVELTGGNDGLNTVVPFKDPQYKKLRPTLALPEAQLKKVNDQIGLHPSLGGLAQVLQDGALCVVQGVGYPNPDQSHFRSMDIWQAASMAQTFTEGWLGKALKSLPGTPAFHLKTDNENSPLALEGAPVRPPSIKTLEEFQLQLTAASGADKQAQRAVIEAGARPTSAGGLIDFVQRTAASTYASSRRLREIGKNYQPKSPYPETPLGGRLKLCAQLIDAGLRARIFYVAHGNFDTHSTQAPTHANLLQQLGDATAAFWKDMKARGQGERVLLMTFSEFGRRAMENGSHGTDHGAAAPMFLVGGRVKAGAVGAHPSLTDVPMGNLQYHTDFRQVYAAILERYLGVSSKEVLGGVFTPANVLKV